MDKFEKNFVVHGSGQDYDVRFTSDGEKVKAHCSCHAGAYKVLCKHVLQCINADNDVRFALTQCGFLQVYEEYEARLRYSEGVKREAKK